MSSEQPARTVEGMAGLAKGLAIVEAFGAADGRLTIADAARHAGVARATARRCLLTLADLGYVEYDGKFFRLLPRVLRLSAAYRGKPTLQERVQPVLDAARAALNESISLAVLDGDAALFLARAEATHLVSTNISLGARLPAHCSATGRILLARYPDAYVAALLSQTDREARTEKTITGVDALVAIVAEARTTGYAVSDEELELGMRSMAVAVHDESGTIAAALSVSVSSARVPMTDFKRDALPVLQRYARMLDRTIDVTSA
jgi:IclR family pca regulon transcriptional regulator